VGKNRPTGNTYNVRNGHYDIVGFNRWLTYFIRWAVISSILSALAMFVWNDYVGSIFNFRDVTYLETLGLWVLLALVRVAFYSLKYLVIRPYTVIK
jgi:hypothetical protein